jgi:hypothetical protein
VAISKRLRFEILRRDNHMCRYCGASAPEVKLTVDHVIPESLGGRNEPENLVTACADCNNGKSSIPANATTVAEVQRDAIRWARAIRAAANSLVAEQEHLRKRCEWFGAAWSAWQYGPPDARQEVPRAASWRETLTRLWAAGVTDALMNDLLVVAMEANHVDIENRWRYFCGCAWRRVDELHERAQEIVETIDSSVYFARN